MREKEKSTADLVRTTCEADIKAAREAFDQRLLAEAEKLASLSKESSDHHEFYYPLGMLAVPPMPMAHLLMPLWVAEGAHPGLVGRVSLAGPIGFPSTGSLLAEASSDKVIQRLQLKPADPLPDAEVPSSEKTADRSHQFVQIERPISFNPSERLWTTRPELVDQLTRSYPVRQYSESLGGQQFPMSNKERVDLNDHRFDEIDLSPSVKVRRVMIKTITSHPKSGRVLFFSTDGRLTGKVWSLQKDLKLTITQPEQPKQPADKTPKKDGKGGKGVTPGGGTPRQYSAYWEFLPFLFVHYAEDTSTLVNKIRAIEGDRDLKIAELAEMTQQELDDLRRQLGWIALATFFSILIGSFLLITLGLAPLSRLSDAVSRVTTRDFRLRIDPEKLPKELMPIAGRLSETLEELGKAFAREKQAAADISHELRTPLAALLTTAEVGLKKTRSVEEYRELLQDCKLSGDQMMQLVERLLALARLDASADRLKTAPVDVGNLAQQCADLVRPLAEARGLDLQVHAGDSLSVLADGSKLREVLTNLLHNAIQYNKPDGSIDLTVERQNGHLLMEVRDTGIGISPEARSHIFERFYRADPSRHSDTPHAGLGLAIVKSYIELMGGRIDVDSSSEGSTFRVQVPAVDAEVPSDKVMARS